MKKMELGLIGALMIGAALPLSGELSAGEVEILEVSADQTGSGSWRFSVTLRHADEGWDHYADLWQVLTPDGNLLGERVLAHPHVDEQPFTRSLGNVEIPEGMSQVRIRARDSVHGFTSTDLIFSLVP